ncbi:MAG: tetratricopeptide repeat protein [Kiritimatiellales bacterium]|nr:tetratricopeptide repeat protein [Kiritimatiellales bacterium]
MMKHILLAGLLLHVLPGTLSAQETNSISDTGFGLQIAERTDEERIDFLLEVATAYFSEGDHESAINAYERVLEIDPLNLQARFIIGHSYIRVHQYAKAEKMLTQLIEDFPEDFKLRNNLAWLYATATDPAFRDGQKAIRLAREAMVLAPYDHHVWSTLAEAYYTTGQYEKAYQTILHMASLAVKYGDNITKQSVAGYNEQIRKCKRAWDTQKMISGEDAEDAEE